MDDLEIYLAPDKPFLLMCKNADDSGDVLFWCQTREELDFVAKHNTAVTPYDAIEIGSCRRIDIESK